MLIKTLHSHTATLWINLPSMGASLSLRLHCWALECTLCLAKDFRWFSSFIYHRLFSLANSPRSLTTHSQRHRLSSLRLPLTESQPVPAGVGLILRMSCIAYRLSTGGGGGVGGEINIFRQTILRIKNVCKRLSTIHQRYKEIPGPPPSRYFKFLLHFRLNPRQSFIKF